MNKAKGEPGLTEIQRDEIKAIVNSALLGFKASLRNELGLLEELLNNPNVQENLQKERLKNQAPHSASEEDDSEKRAKEVIKPRGKDIVGRKEEEESKRPKPARTAPGKNPAPPKKEEKKMVGKLRATNPRAQYKTESGKQNEESDDSNNKGVRNMSEEENADNLEIESASSKEEKPSERKEASKKPVKKDIRKAYASTGKRVTGKPVKSAPPKEEENAEEEEENNEEEEEEEERPAKVKSHKEASAKTKTSRQPKPQDESKKAKKPKRINNLNQDDY